MPYTPNHNLSDRAIEQGWNVFLWSSGTGKLLMGWRIDKDFIMTIATMHRWATTVNFLFMKALEEPWTLSICPVDVQPLATTGNDSSYNLLPTGGFLEQDSKRFLSPGDYCLFKEDGSTHPFDFKHDVSFETCSGCWRRGDPRIWELSQLPSSLEDRILQRDSRCGISYADKDFSVTWVVPPVISVRDSQLLPKEAPGADLSEEEHIQSCIVPTNAFVIADDLWLLFNHNLIGIDVDDHYRIVCFAKRDDIKWQFRTHLHAYVGRYLDDRFLRRHFAQCLASSTCCGVASSDDSDEEDGDSTGIDETVTADADADDSGDLSPDGHT